MGREYIGHHYVGHGYIGHDYIGHHCMCHCRSRSVVMNCCYPLEDSVLMDFVPKKTRPRSALFFKKKLRVWALADEGLYFPLFFLPMAQFGLPPRAIPGLHALCKTKQKI